MRYEVTIPIMHDISECIDYLSMVEEEIDTNLKKMGHEGIGGTGTDGNSRDIAFYDVNEFQRAMILKTLRSNHIKSFGLSKEWA